MRGLLAAVAISLVTSTAAGQDSDYVEQWLDVPQNQAALAVYADWQDAPTTPILVVSDAASRRLDEVKWLYPLPLLRQYRLEPGAYDIHIEGFDRSKTVNLQGGELAFLRLDLKPDDNTLNPAFVARDQAAAIKLKAVGILEDLGLKRQFDQTKPIALDPMGHALYFNTEPPFEIPKPQTEPKPQ
jgi:hypothetical protein